MKNLVEQINAQVAAFQANAAAQVEKNNKAAGTRARKAALELSKLLKEFRKVSVEEAKKEFLLSCKNRRISFRDAPTLFL